MKYWRVQSHVLLLTAVALHLVCASEVWANERPARIWFLPFVRTAERN